MSFRQSLKGLEKRYALSVLSVVLAIIFGGISVYLGFIKEEKPDLNYRIISKAGVFEIREQLQDISLQYDGIDILEADKSLSIIVFKAINDGNESILNDFYAPSSPLGFKITNGSLLNVELINASNNYIKNNLAISSDSSYATFSPLIIDPKESFTIKSLVLHPSDSIPDIQSIGKIAKHDKVNVVDLNNEVESSFFLRIWQGSFFIHLTRFILYFFTLFFSLVALVVIIILPSEKIKSMIRKGRVKKFKKRSSKNLDNLNNIFDYYIQRGSQNLMMYQTLVEEQEKLTKLVEVQSLQKSINSKKEELDFHSHLSWKSKPTEDLFMMETFKDLDSLGIISKENGKFEINEDLRSDLEDFIQYLQIIENQSMWA